MTRSAGNKLRTFQRESLLFSGIFKGYATYGLIKDFQFTQGLPLLGQKLDQPSCSQHVPSAGLLLSAVVQIKRQATY